MQQRGERLVINLRMSARTLPDVQSRNVVAEIRGREKPGGSDRARRAHRFVGHGQGAMDDAGGSVATWEAVRLMKVLGLRPRRTVPMVQPDQRENGLRGATPTGTDTATSSPTTFSPWNRMRAPSSLPDSASPDRTRSRSSSRSALLLERIEVGRIVRGGGGAILGRSRWGSRNGLLDVMEPRASGAPHRRRHHRQVNHEMALCAAAMAVMAYVVAIC